MKLQGLRSTQNMLDDVTTPGKKNLKSNTNNRLLLITKSAGAGGGGGGSGPLMMINTFIWIKNVLKSSLLIQITVFVLLARMIQK